MHSYSPDPTSKSFWSQDVDLALRSYPPSVDLAGEQQSLNSAGLSPYMLRQASCRHGPGTIRVV